MTHRWFASAIPVIVVLVGFPAAAQQTTGALKGYVKDSQGLVLPGVTITVSGPALMGLQEATTDQDGYYRLLNLPPGLYRVEARLEGFAPFTTSNVRVEVGTTTPLDITLSVAAYSEQVTVSGAAPVVDLERSERAFVVNQSAIAAIPIQPRLGYQGVWQVLPGVTGGDTDYLGNEGGDPQVNAGFRENESGSAGVRNQNDAYENNIFIDGMDANDPMSGKSTTNLSYEVIEEVNVKTAGFEAEFGSSRSSQMQIVTKSGGNVFSGSALFQFQPEDWNWANIEGGSSEKLSYYNPSIVMGGPIMRDRLWFFGSWKYDFENLTYPDTQVLDTMNRERRGNLWYGKITAQVNEANRVFVAAGYDKVDIRNASNDARYSTEAAMLTNERGGPLLSVVWTSTLNPRMLLQTTVGYNSKPIVSRGQGEGPRRIYYDRYLGNVVKYDGNSNRWYDSQRESIYIHPNLTIFPTRDMWGSHEFKFGFESRPYQKINRAYIYFTDPNGYFDFRYGMDYERYGLSEPYLYQVQTVFPPGPYNEVKVSAHAAYAQDRWRIGEDLTISAGLRWEQSTHRTYGRSELPPSLEIFDPDIRDDVELEDWAIAPRLGLAYKLGEGSDVVRASYGRFSERVGTGDYNNYPRGQGFDTYRIRPEDFGKGVEALYLFTSGTIPVNPDFNRDMKMEYNDEITVGYERRLPWDLALDAAFIYRDINISESRDANVIFNPDGTFTRIDPTFDRVNMREFLEGDDRLRDVTFKSLQFSVRRNFTRNVGLMASYSHYWTKEDWRRFDETEIFQFAYDSPDDMDRTNYGPRWNYKISGFYLFPKGFSLSAFVNAYSGEWVNDITGDYAWNADAPRITLPNGRRVADIIWQARNSYYAGKKWGERGRHTDNVYNVNVRLTKEFTFGRRRLEASIDAFNVFNWAAYTGFLSSDVRRTDRYGEKVNPQRPRAMQANLRFVF